MTEQTSCNSSDDENIESVLYPKDVATRDAKLRNEDHDGVKLGELRVFGLGGEHWRSFQLYEASPGEWKSRGLIEFPPGVVGICCVVEQEGDTDSRITHIGYSSWKYDTPEGDTGNRKPGRISDAQLRLPMPWKSVEIATPKWADNGGRWKQQRRAEGRSEQGDQIR
ncbi:hypothetical protein FA13DRAFT_1787226 [Coprinellus micaceus]|uniref:Uncharacterized protein n=1 Tax=Coprinellus micaceus TaxID=71717 RepID=A0A4Y7TRW9_COPMI|nr:hypothetical protein FA13DRAFT_1787226 [Coprinellus micaceus]